jgi:dienelactone hydrolase
MIRKHEPNTNVRNRTLAPLEAWADWLRLALLLGIPGLLVSYASGAAANSFPEVSSLTAQAALPDPLVMLDGRRVSSKAQWVNERRPELKALFQHYMYGDIPPKPAHMDTKALGEYHDFLSGKATLKLVRLEMGSPNAPQIDLMLVLPNEPKGPAPVFLAMDFCGNHALTDDPRVPLARSWLGSGCKGCTNNAATEAARGAQAGDWPLADIVRRGYGLAAFYSGDVDPDRTDVSEGIYAWLANGDPAKNNPTNRGTIAAWTWGFERCVDYLVTDHAVDAHRIAALGHSRNGKTALLAAAFDERIAMAFPHQAGCGGSAPSRSQTGESVKAINDRFPHWFNAQFKLFNGATERLPFDQNCLVALCAPRPVLFTAATGDQWSNPAGQFQVLQATDPVYRFLGSEGLAAKEAPPVHKLVASRLGYYLREGKHSMTADDWAVFMDYADSQWRK